MCATLALLAACADALTVPNENDPDRDRVLQSPADVETIIGNSYAAMHDQIADNIAISAQMLSMGMENHSILANFEMGPRGLVPRGAISNQRGNAGQGEHINDWRGVHTAARLASLGLEAFRADGFTVGSPGADARARAFAKFVQGVALGNLALVYDSGAVVTEFDDPGVIVPLAGYDSVMRAAIASLDSAVAIATAAATFPNLPDTWLSGNALNTAGFIRFVRSYRARFRAGVARNPAERAAVNWTAVIADVTNGITADFNISMNPVGPWDVQWVAQHYLFTAWHQMWQFMIGFADVSGGFDAWLATPNDQRQPFLIITPDRRFPQGATRPEQVANSPAVPAGNLYFRNRPGLDPTALPLGFSYYDHYRFQGFYNVGRIGPFPVMTKAEMDLLAAEGHIRTGNIAAAAALIDVSRVGKGNLPSLVAAGISDLTTPVPGGASCVPRVPVGPAFTSAACGNILEALKWEYRMETAYIGYGSWYIAGRGWGDLPEGTAVHWPVPYQEMDARRTAFYDMGGVGQPGGSECPCTYGLRTGGVY
jgi:hypothetical protein